MHPEMKGKPMAEGKNAAAERRRRTKNRMFRYIYNAEQPVTKQQLAEAVGFSAPIVQQNISELVEEGVVIPAEIQKSTGGRPPVAYAVNAGVRYSIGVAVSSNHLRILLSDICQKEVAYKRMRLAASDGDGIGEQIASELLLILSEQHIDPEKVLGVGITLPALIDQKHNLVITSPTLKMKNLSLTEIRKRIPFPTYVDNDSTCGGVAEWHGRPKTARRDDFVYLFIENGVGGAIFIDGKPYFGRNHRSGEFGHMCVVPGGRPCNCGRKGCLEAYLGASLYSRDLGITLEEFFDELSNGNEEYMNIWNEVLHYLAVGIANLRLAFDCDVVLGGMVSQYLPPYMDRLKALTKEQNPFDDGAEYIRLGRFPTKAGMMGAAWHFTQEFINQI
jgi:predicted NBD/HSP70 family sugar kinase